MARTKKSQSKRAKAKPAPKRRPAKTKPKKSKKSTGRSESDVENRWREYLRARTALEQSVATVREATQRLTDARAEERTRREAFDATKNALKDLLEVEPAGGAPAGMLDFTAARPGDLELEEPAP